METHRKILEAIIRLQGRPHRFVGDSEIAADVGLDLEEVRDCLPLMEESGLVHVSITFGGGRSVQPTPQGRVALRDPAYMQPKSSSGDTFYVAGNFQGAILNVKSILQDVNQTIGRTPHADKSLRDELQSLIDQLNEALQQVPAPQIDEAEAVAETAKELVETATAEKPNRVRIKITSDGLKKAAETLASVMPQVLVIATQIVDTIAKVTRAGSVK